MVRSDRVTVARHTKPVPKSLTYGLYSGFVLSPRLQFPCEILTPYSILQREQISL
jgi:hypothetical protein